MRKKYSQVKARSAGKVRLSLNLDNLVSMSKARPTPGRRVKYYRLGDKSMSEAKIVADAKLPSWKTWSYKSPWVHEVKYPSREKNVEYGLKQKIKYYYGLSQGEWNKLAKRAKSERKNIFSVIESRADILLCRANLAISIFEARELIKQGAVKLNNKIIYYPNEQVPIGGELKINSQDAARTLLRIKTIFKASKLLLSNKEHILYKGLNSIVLKELPNCEKIPFPVHIPVNKIRTA